MVIYVGEGDPRASMELLWGVTPPRSSSRGPKPGLSLDAIVETAVAIADEHGIDAVSMRAVGERLGRTPMALYTYVPGKAELVDLMWDRVLGSLPSTFDRSGGWRPGLWAWARAYWAFYQQRPWTLQISGARPGLGPNETRNLETAAALLEDAGLAGRDRIRVVWSVARYVHGAARALAETRAATSETGVGEDEWWQARSGMLAEVAPDYGERFPTLTRLAREGSFDVDPPEVSGMSYLETEALDTFEFGLARMLDGVAVLLSGR
jgi:AcrR family transcriptional regulator